jgi:hypothetical protein
MYLPYQNVLRHRRFSTLLAVPQLHSRKIKASKFYWWLCTDIFHGAILLHFEKNSNTLLWPAWVIILSKFEGLLLHKCTYDMSIRYDILIKMIDDTIYLIAPDFMRLIYISLHLLFNLFNLIYLFIKIVSQALMHKHLYLLQTATYYW